MRRLLAAPALLVCLTLAGCAQAADALGTAKSAVEAGGALQQLCSQTAAETTKTTASPEFRQLLLTGTSGLITGFEALPADFPERDATLTLLRKAEKQLDNPDTDLASVARTLAPLCDAPGSSAG